MRHILIISLFASLLLYLFGADAALAQGERALTSDVDLGESDIYQESLKALTVLLVVAVLIESALALVFNWKVFRTYFSERGLKTIISFAVSFSVVRGFELDIMASLLDAYGTSSKEFNSTLATEVLTALIVSGGSAGMNSIMISMGYRREPTPEKVEPPKDKAWIAVRVNRKLGKGAMQVTVTEDKAAPATLPAMAGTVMASRPGLMSLLMRNTNRFPCYGGYAVVPGTTYQISLIGMNVEGDRTVVPIGGGPVKLAPGAVVDFDVTL